MRKGGIRADGARSRHVHVSFQRSGYMGIIFFRSSSPSRQANESAARTAITGGVHREGREVSVFSPSRSTTRLSSCGFCFGRAKKLAVPVSGQGYYFVIGRSSHGLFQSGFTVQPRGLPRLERSHGTQPRYQQRRAATSLLKHRYSRTESKVGNQALCRTNSMIIENSSLRLVFGTRTLCWHILHHLT